MSSSVAATSLLVQRLQAPVWLLFLLPPPGPHLSPPPPLPSSSADTVALGRDHTGAATRGGGPAVLSPGWRRSDDTGGGGSGAALGCGRSAMCARAHRRCSSVRPTRQRSVGPATRRLIPLPSYPWRSSSLPLADRMRVLFRLEWRAYGGLCYLRPRSARSVSVVSGLVYTILWHFLHFDDPASVSI